MVDPVEGIIGVLLDSEALWEDRHDAALDMSDFNEDRVIEALLVVATNPHEDDTLVETCGETLGLVWIRREALDINNLNRLLPMAYHDAYAVIQAHKPEWIQKYQMISVDDKFKEKK